MSCPSCFLQSWKSCCLVLIILATTCSFLQQTYAYTTFGMNEREIPLTTSTREKFKREAASSARTVFNRTTISSLFGSGPSMSERKQRFCLSRLRDALQLVCSSGSFDNLPQYFNPSQHPYKLNDTAILPGGHAKNLRNDIPTMVRPSGGHILRRRSRRNIVRECCEKPCSYSNMKKYCSPNVRLPDNHDSNIYDDNQPVYGLSPPASQQCVTVADLQSYYLKFFRKQWKKDAFPSQHHGQVQEPDFGEPVNIDNRKQLKELSNTSPAAGQPEEETRDDNEINEMTENVAGSSHNSQSGNIMTLPPINKIVNLPRGTNDYFY